MDDGATEASAGVVDLIRIYDAPMSAAEAAALGGPVPEPSSIVMSLFAAAGLIAVAVRRRRAA